MKDISDFIQQKAQRNPVNEGDGFCFWIFEENDVKGMYYEFSHEQLWVLYGLSEEKEEQSALLYLRSKTPEGRDFINNHDPTYVNWRLSNLD